MTAFQDAIYYVLRCQQILNGNHPTDYKIEGARRWVEFALGALFQAENHPSESQPDAPKWKPTDAERAEAREEAVRVVSDHFGMELGGSPSKVWKAELELAAEGYLRCLNTHRSKEPTP